MSQAITQRGPRNNQPEEDDTEDVNSPRPEPGSVVQEASIIAQDTSSKKRRRSASGHEQFLADVSKRHHALQNDQPQETSTRAANAPHPGPQPIVQEASPIAPNLSWNKRKRSTHSQDHFRSGGTKRLRHGDSRPQHAVTTAAAVVAVTWRTESRPGKRDRGDEHREKSRKRRRNIGNENILREERKKKRGEKRRQERRERRRVRNGRSRRYYSRIY